MWCLQAPLMGGVSGEAVCEISQSSSVELQFYLLRSPMALDQDRYTISLSLHTPIPPSACASQHHLVSGIPYKIVH